MRLQGEKKGNSWNLRKRKSFNIPGLLFADDLILIGQNCAETEKLLAITTEFGSEMDLNFNPSKSAVVVFSSSDAGVDREL